jgi:hypothetical protein
MEIREIQDKVRKEEYEISLHAEKERYAEDISINDLETAIYNGDILEDYTDDPRGPSCLILGYSKNRPIHIVCGHSSTKWIRVNSLYTKATKVD